MCKYESWEERSQSAASLIMAPRKRFLVQSTAAASGKAAARRYHVQGLYSTREERTPSGCGARGQRVQ